MLSLENEKRVEDESEERGRAKAFVMRDEKKKLGTI